MFLLFGNMKPCTNVITWNGYELNDYKRVFIVIYKCYMTKTFLLLQCYGTIERRKRFQVTGEECSVLEYESKSANDMRLWIQISYDVWVVYLLLGNCLNAALWLVDSVYSVNDWFCEWKQSQCCVGYGCERPCYVLFSWRLINKCDTNWKQESESSC